MEIPGHKKSNCAQLLVAAATSDCKVAKVNCIHCNALVNELKWFCISVEIFGAILT